jgi:hypothetical protein
MQRCAAPESVPFTIPGPASQPCSTLTPSTPTPPHPTPPHPTPPHPTPPHPTPPHPTPPHPRHPPPTQFYANDQLEVAALDNTGLTLQLKIRFRRKPMRMRHDVRQGGGVRCELRGRLEIQGDVPPGVSALPPTHPNPKRSAPRPATHLFAVGGFAGRS